MAIKVAGLSLALLLPAAAARAQGYPGAGYPGAGPALPAPPPTTVQYSRDPVPMPPSLPLPAPVAAPLPAPLAAPVAAPMAAPMAAPVAAPVAYGDPIAQVGGGDKGKDDKMQGQYKPGGFSTLEFRNLNQVPSLEVLSRLESQEALFRRMTEEARAGNERLVFPTEPILSKEPFQGRHFVPLAKLVEPAFVVHGRLYFEQPNLERGLWDFGVFTPALSLGKFCWDVAWLPYHAGTRPCQQYDTSAGKCLPGDPTPFYLYPVELSLTGAAAEAAVVTGLVAIFP
jgi:hypothetical protein